MAEEDFFLLLKSGMAGLDHPIIKNGC